VLADRLGERGAALDVVLDGGDGAAEGFRVGLGGEMERHCTMGSPASIMVANCRVKTTMSRAFTGEPKLGTAMSKSSPLPFSLMRDGCGWMRWLRRRMITASRLDASISP